MQMSMRGHEVAFVKMVAHAWRVKALRYLVSVLVAIAVLHVKLTLIFAHSITHVKMVAHARIMETMLTLVSVQLICLAQIVRNIVVACTGAQLHLAGMKLLTCATGSNAKAAKNASS